MSASVVKTASVVRAHSSSKLAGRGGIKTLSLTYPHTESQGVLNQAVVVATNNTVHASHGYTTP